MGRVIRRLRVPRRRPAGTRETAPPTVRAHMPTTEGGFLVASWCNRMAPRRR